MQTTKITLSRGSEGPEVAYLQTILALLGYYKDDINGIFDTRLDHSVKTFQSSHGLRIDGIVGKDTWAKLESEIASLRPRRMPWWGWVIIGAVGYIIGRNIVKVLIKRHRKR